MTYLQVWNLTVSLNGKKLNKFVWDMFPEIMQDDTTVILHF